MNLYLRNLLFLLIFLRNQVVGKFNSYSESESSEGFDPHGNFQIGREIRRAAIGRCGDREFRLFVEKKTWPEAILQCEKKGLEMGEVRTMDEARILAGIMLKNRPDAIESAWIGGYGRKIEGDVSWRWLSGDVIHDDNELWKNQLKDRKNRDKRKCLLLDWHLWEKPSFMGASCDRRREYICQNLINTESTATKVNYDEHRRLLDTATTTSKQFLTSTTMLSTTKSSPSTESPNTFTWSLQKIDMTKNISKLQDDYDYMKDYNYDDDWFDSLTWKLSTDGPPISHAHSPLNSKKEEQKIMTEKIYSTHVQTKSTASSLDIGLNEGKKVMNPLKLYYAFEGPIVGGMSRTESPELRLNFYSNPLPVLRYQKYATRRKHTNYSPKN